MRALLFCAFPLWAAPVAAQTAVRADSSVVSFTASTAHGELVDGLALVDSYTLEIYQGSTLVKVADLGKPTPDANRRISLPLDMQGLQVKVAYTAYVTVIGPGGSARSAPSNPFVWLVAPPAVSDVTVR